MINDDTLEVLSVMLDKKLSEDDIIKVFSYFYLLIRDELASQSLDDDGKLADLELDIGVGTLVCNSSDETITFKFSDEVYEDLMDSWLMGLSDLLYTIQNKLGSRLIVPGLKYHHSNINEDDK